MVEASRGVVRAGLEPCLARLWRYALTLSLASDLAEDLVKATCARAIERADQFPPGTRLDRWLFGILRSIWLDEIRPRQVRPATVPAAADDPPSLTAAHMNILAADALKAIGRLPEPHRETVLLVYGEGYSYVDAAKTLEIPIGTIISRLAAARAALAKQKQAHVDFDEP
jgi:RNA polymerase sigma-70 factor (ECF subfamily)